MTHVCFSVCFSSLLVCTICLYSNWSLCLVKNVILPEKLKLLIFSFFSVFVIVCFLSTFGAKNKHTSPTSSESAKIFGHNKSFGRKVWFVVEITI